MFNFSGRAVQLARSRCSTSRGICISEDADPSEKFWMLEKRIKEDRKKTGVQLEMSRSKLIYNIIALINEGAISFENLDEFSDELKETVSALIER